MRVQLIAETNVEPTVLSSHAAKMCYTATPPELGALIDVKGRLFSTGHHTTLQHSSFTFMLDDVPVSAMCFGLHLNAPFYNSDQRSGRFSQMYNNPDMDSIYAHIKQYYPDVSDDLVNEVLNFVRLGAQIYARYLPQVTSLAVQSIKAERPFANDKYIEQNAPKFAQEQLRMFISQIAPTGLDFTVNLTALAALYRVAWSPEMRALTAQMASEVVARHPDLGYVFESGQTGADWAVNITADAHLQNKPKLELLSVDVPAVSDVKMPDTVDILPFSPLAMNDNMCVVKTLVEMSCATMGQDQRHRSIKRSLPELTGAFYLPPLLDKAGLGAVAQDYMNKYVALARKIPSALAMAITPYGAMVRYQKRADINALKHEQAKRMCWCAQEEIYHLGVQLKQALSQDPQGKQLADRLCPPCYCDKCIEGVRYCGRNIKDKENYFCSRQV